MIKPSDIYNEFVKTYINIIKKLKDNPDFIREDKVRSKDVSKTHIMYKLDLGGGNTRLYSKDRKYYYEFLVEFDHDDSGYGIYYGCKLICENTDEKYKDSNEFEGIINHVNEEWKKFGGIKIKKEKGRQDKEVWNADTIKYILNNVIKNKKYFNLSFIPTNNYNDNTYWPFWIRLHEEEDIELAAYATKIIANFYSVKINGKRLFEDYDFDSSCKIESKDSKDVANYTFKSYDLLLKQLKKFLEKIFGIDASETVDEKIGLYKKFLQKSYEKGYLKKNDFYEFAWDINEDKVQAMYYSSVISQFSIKLFPEEVVQWKFFEPLITNDLKSSAKFALDHSKYNPTEVNKIHVELID